MLVEVRKRGESLTIVFRNQFPHLGYKLPGNTHNGFRRLDASFVFDESVLLALLFIVSEYAPDLLRIPSFWEILFAHCCFFLRRLRNAARGFPVSSYAVMTNTLSGSGSGT